MSLFGQVISHDQRLGAGVIRVQNSPHSVMFKDHDVVGHAPGSAHLLGRFVFFDVIQTPQGLNATNVRLARKKLLAPGEWLVALATPVILLATTYGLKTELGWPVLHSYLVAVNLVAFMLAVIMASRPLTYETRPSEVVLFILAAAGGAVSTLFASCLVRSKMRSDIGRFALFALIVAQGMVLFKYFPGFFTRESFAIFLGSDVGGIKGR